ncbi:MAG: DUF58 domain-containing protein [Anaerolineae bacterium]
MAGLAALLLFLLLLAALLRIDFYFYLFYLILGVVLLGRWWAQRAQRAVSYRRRFPSRVFWGEQPTIELDVHNRSLLPVLWLHVHDSLPIELRSPNFYQQALSLMPRESATLSYRIACRRRGYYRLGPVTLQSGDLLGTLQATQTHTGDETLIVYPRIIPLTGIALPSRTPHGTLPSRQRLFEDPTRIMGVRDYVPGDSLRHIAWKTSAVMGHLQTRRYQPAIALDTMLFLDMDRRAYSAVRQRVATELAVVVAASLANWLVERRQAVGLASNGHDPLAAGMPTVRQPRKGRGALVSTLEVLARLERSDGPDLPGLLRRESAHLAWGSTIVVITGRVSEELFAALAHLKRRGFALVLISTDPSASFQAVRRRAASIAVPAYQVWEETDLERWGLRLGDVA